MKTIIKCIFLFVIVPMLLASMLIGCSNNTDDNGRNVTAKGLIIASIDGCQYVIYNHSHGDACAMVHVGSCNNTIHQK